MDSNLRELLDLVVRWVHLIAGIMWVGNSMLFNWLDRNLIKPDPHREGMEGTIWMLHSGGFYEVEKKQLAPNEFPEILHWFKWQSYTTWMSGALLLIIVYYMGGGGLLVDSSVFNLSVPAAISIGVGTLVGGWLVYDLLWRSPLRYNAKVAAPLSFALACGAAYALTHVLSGRAAYMHVGAMLGTLMAGNVFFHIIPSQRQLVAATKAGQIADPSIAANAKQRSIHNNYITFPLLFIMVSNHFPSTFGNPYNWLILIVLILTGAGVRHWMNIRFYYKAWQPALAATLVAGFALLVFLVSKSAVPSVAHAQTPVSFSEARVVVAQRCASCHSSHPTDDVFKAAPNGVVFDTPEQIQRMAERINVRAVSTKTMPLNNKTGITPAERALLGSWVAGGAHLQ